jgi:23S rRNA pseudouridine1911/1915/1917 synthase
MDNFRIGDLVLVNNHKFIICDKPFGMPVQEDKTGDKALISLAEIFCKKKLFPVNRIDRPVKGLVVFAKAANTANILSKMIQNGQIEKWYLAITRTQPEAKMGILEHHLFHNKKSNKSELVDSSTKDAKLAKLEYQIIGKSDNYHYWMIKLLTGRHHQIRAQLAAIGCPVKGDLKYGDKRTNQDKSIHLLSWKLKFNEQVHNKVDTVEAEIPDEVLWQYLKENISLQWKNK